MINFCNKTYSKRNFIPTFLVQCSAFNAFIYKPFLMYTHYLVLLATRYNYRYILYS
jgi:hypothetical protein